MRSVPYRFWTPRSSLLSWCSSGLAIIAGLLLAGHLLAFFSWTPSTPCQPSTRRSRTLTTRSFALATSCSLQSQVPRKMPRPMETRTKARARQKTPMSASIVVVQAHGKGLLAYPTSWRTRSIGKCAYNWNRPGKCGTISITVTHQFGCQTCFNGFGCCFVFKPSCI